MKNPEKLYLLKTNTKASPIFSGPTLPLWTVFSENKKGKMILKMYANRLTEHAINHLQ